MMSFISVTSHAENAANKSNTEKISLSSQATATVKNTQVDVRAKKLRRWLIICKKTLKTMKKYRFRYSKSGGKSTLKKSIKSKRRSNCAYYVSWCLQQYGALNSGGTFYASGNSIHSKNCKWSSKKVTIIRVNKKCSNTELHPGDVVCWKGVPHVCIYAGRLRDGTRYWFDGGKIATVSNSNGSRYITTSAKALGYLNSRTISYIIRIKGL